MQKIKINHTGGKPSQHKNNILDSEDNEPLDKIIPDNFSTKNKNHKTKVKF